MFILLLIKFSANIYYKAWIAVKRFVKLFQKFAFNRKQNFSLRVRQEFVFNFFEFTQPFSAYLRSLTKFPSKSKIEDFG